MSKITLKKAKKKAWDAFAKWYRKDATKNGFVNCYTCGKPTEFEQIQPGHWMTGHTNTNYINVDYIRPQCWACNVPGKGQQGIFWERIKKEIGTKEFEYLKLHNKDFKNITIPDYIEIERKYKELLEGL